MKAFRVTPGTGLHGRVSVPGDKSISHRAAMLGAIAAGSTRITGFLEGADCLATLDALRALGVSIDRDDQALQITGLTLRGLSAPEVPLDFGNSGTGMRLLAGVLAGQSFDSILTGDESLMRRPMERVAAPLRQMGGRVQTTEGHPPIRIYGGTALDGIEYALPVPSAQVKSAILLAGLYADGDTVIHEPVPTRDHTERMLEAFSVPIERYGERLRLHGPAQPVGASIDIPGDFSSAAFPMLAGCLAQESTIEIPGVGLNPTRTGFLTLMERMGGKVESRAHDIDPILEPVGDLTVTTSMLEGIEISGDDVALSIDEFPLLFVAAARARGVTRITGAEELRNKESDRISVMVEGLKRLGVDIRELEDGAVIMGGRVSGGSVDSHGDHRVAMAFAVLGGVAEDVIEIRDVDNVATSFPGFVDLMNGMGSQIEVIDVK